MKSLIKVRSIINSIYLRTSTVKYFQTYSNCLWEIQNFNLQLAQHRAESGPTSLGPSSARTRNVI